MIHVPDFELDHFRESAADADGIGDGHWDCEGPTTAKSRRSIQDEACDRQFSTN